MHGETVFTNSMKKNKKMNPSVFIAFFVATYCSPVFSSFSQQQQEQQLLKSIHGPLESFKVCLSSESHHHSRVDNITHNFWSPSYPTLLMDGIRNLRFNSSATPKPYFIVTPENPHHVRATIICSKRDNLEMRILGSGHDYEGLSYISPKPFIILDTVRLRKFHIDWKKKTGWVGAGLTLGELYYRIAEKSLTHTFPAGVCPSVGLGGHVSGGGQGMMMRNFGLAADNVIDARIVDARGRVLDRKKMGEDLFWAIRGGGASSFAVVLEWKIRLVEVPPVVTVFSVTKLREENASRLLFRWQETIKVFPKNLSMRVIVFPSEKQSGKISVSAQFYGLYLGRTQELLDIIKTDFLELQLRSQHCQEMSWINTTLYFDSGEHHKSLEDLLDRNHFVRSEFKAKADYVTRAIQERNWEGIFDRVQDGRGTAGRNLLLQPYGGKMSEIPSDAIAFPHRVGALYILSYSAFWKPGNDAVRMERLDWLYKTYEFMTDYVEKPRTGYLNYRDLDLGKNNYADDSYEEAVNWGRSYFKDNFNKLVQIKHRVDPDNFFRHEQSIPPFGDKYSLFF